ncbi:MAG: hypothetical protein KKB31_05915 [Nanoarchaeota archaeon]|nr:hypothetical protein [Nanoarchaeota archaeon]
MIFDLENFPVTTIKIKIKKEFINPYTKFLEAEKPQFKSEIHVCVQRANLPAIMKQNNFFFFNTDDGYMIGTDLNGKKMASVPFKHQFLFDKTNKRIILSGKNLKQGWIPVKTAPLY